MSTNNDDQNNIHPISQDSPLKEDQQKRKADDITTPSTEGENQAGIGLAKKSKLSAKKKKCKGSMPQRKVFVNVVKTSTTANPPVDGVVIAPTGHVMDEHSTDLLHRRGKDPQKQAYVDDINCVPRVVYCKDKHGLPISQEGKDKVYETMSLVFTCFDRDDMTKSELGTWLETDYKNSASNVIAERYKDKINDEDYPKPTSEEEDDNEFIVVDSWDKAVTETKNIEFIVNDILTQADGKRKTLGTWLREDQDHLYAMFTAGKVDLEFVKKYILPLKILKEADKERYCAKCGKNE